MKSPSISDPFDVMQRAFQPSSDMRETARKNLESFWTNQDKILDRMQEYAAGWLERRHLGTHSALEAAQKMCEAETPFDLMREYQSWAGSAYERIMADGIECQKHLIAASAMLTPLLTSNGSDVDTATETRTKQQARTRVAA